MKGSGNDEGAKIADMILGRLIDKYEKSRSYIGENKVRQRFSIRITDVFPGYADHSQIDIFRSVNDTAEFLRRKGFVKIDADPAGVIRSVFLEIEKLHDVYAFLGRIPKSDTDTDVRRVLDSYINANDILCAFCKQQLERLERNRSVRFFSGDLREFENVLEAVKEIHLIKEEMFFREFSIMVFRDSKVFDGIQGKVESLLFEFGDFPEKESVLASFDLVRTPSYVNFKGNGRICVCDEVIDLRNLRGRDIALSSGLLPDIGSIEVFGKKVITVENLTSFHLFCEPDFFVIYLGGFHNSVRGAFIRRVFEQNPDSEFFHFGDIDAGGFHILDHLRRSTGVGFVPYCMDVETLTRFQEFWKPLSDNDKKRLNMMLEKYGSNGEFGAVIGYMLRNECKLEQEAVRATGGDGGFKPPSPPAAPLTTKRGKL